MRETNRKIDYRFAPPDRWTNICRPDDPFKTLVNEQGALLYGFDPRASAFVQTFRRIFKFSLFTSDRLEKVEQRTESAVVPIVVTELHYPKAVLELTTVGHQYDGHKRSDVMLWKIISHTDNFMTSLQIDAIANRIEYQIRESGTCIDFEPAVETEALEGPLSLLSTHPLRQDRPSDHGPHLGLTTDKFLLHAGQSVNGALIFPLNVKNGAPIELQDAVRALDEERHFWNHLALQPLGMSIPDPDLQDLIIACARNILQAREIKDGIPEFQVGATCYRGLWVVDGHFLLEAAQYLGLGEEAFLGLQALLKRVRPSGAIEQFDFHPKETGISLYTFVRQCELTGRDDKLIELWDIIRNAVRHIGNLRERSKINGPDSPEYGLMPPAFGDGGISGVRPEYTTALWSLIGLKEAWKAAERLDQTDDAEKFRAEFEGLMSAFREHSLRDMRTLPDGTPYLPMLKPGSGEHTTIVNYEGVPDPWDRANPGTSTWALAHAIYPGELFAPDDPIVTNFCRLLDQIDDEEGIPSSTGWLPFESVWTYAASFYAHVWLYAGNPVKAADYLYAFANHAAPTRVWREEQSLKLSGHGRKVGDMPHNWASAELIRLVRHLLVFERGGSLELLPGLPEEWIKPGKPVVLERTPTRYGPVSLRFEVNSVHHWTLRVEMDGNWKLRPEQILVRCPVLPGSGQREIIVNRRPLNPEADGWIRLPWNEVYEISV